MLPEQHISSQNTSWYPGDNHMQAWTALLHSMRVHIDTELSEPTFDRKSVQRDSNEIAWVQRTLDFCAVAYDPVRHASWQCSVTALGSYGSGRASNHKAVELRFRRRRSGAPRSAASAKKYKPLPEWLFNDEQFAREWGEAVGDWRRNRSYGLQGLHEFAELTQTWGRCWLEENAVEAKTDDHRFDVCMSVQTQACSGRAVRLSIVSKWFAIYPALRDMIELHIDTVNSSVRVHSTEVFVRHVHELAQRVVEHRLRDRASLDDDGVSGGATLQAGKPYARAACDIKSLMPQRRHAITELWNETRTEVLTDPKEIGNVIRETSLARSGTARGDDTRGQHLLSQCNVDLSSCRTHVSFTETMRILLSVKSGRRPGTTGVCATAYKRQALSLAPVFQEAFSQLQLADLSSELIPRHLHESLWFPAAKKEGADSIGAIRDLELPNEDCKILERMLALVVDEVAAKQLLPLQQAFISGGDIMYNVLGLHDEFSSSLTDRRLRLIILMDCTKGFNYISHNWARRVWAALRLPAGLARCIVRLLETQHAILIYAGLVFDSVRWQSGFRQGGPFSSWIFVLVVSPFLFALSQIPGSEWCMVFVTIGRLQLMVWPLSHVSTRLFVNSKWPPANVSTGKKRNGFQIAP